MANLVWGKAQQLSCADDHEYYQALGSLCRRGSYTILYETLVDSTILIDTWRHYLKFFIKLLDAWRFDAHEQVALLAPHHDGVSVTLPTGSL